ncbi:helix-turn-helix domain-containing protein [Proteus mirabilis]|uniref:helix-turn-helix domain-containing protein n=1 Tax=Proteus mirabilis TaxID=584 RepID=UPI0034E5C745
MGKNSIRSFASECGISDTTIRKHLSGQSLPDIDKIEAIVKYTGCSLEWLSARCQSVSFIDNFSFLLNCENLAVTPWCNRVRQ